MTGFCQQIRTTVAGGATTTSERWGMATDGEPRQTPGHDAP
jgi:hypothetical protein